MCKELELLGCDVKIAVTGSDPENILNRERIKIFEIRIKVLRLISYWIYGYIQFIYNFIKFKPDVVILDIYSIWFSIPFIFLPNRKTVFFIDDRTPRYCRNSDRSNFRDSIMRYYTKLSYQFCKHFLDGMTVITEYYKRFVHKNFMLPGSFIEVWGSGVDINRFSYRKTENSIKPPYLENKFVVMQHGEFSNNRGILETIEAIALINREDVKLLLIGDGTIKNDIFQKIKLLGIEDRVKVLPPVSHSEIPEYISYCDCAIMAYPNIEYWNNNNPIKLLEYLAMGKVVICTDMWTFRDVGGDKKCVYYIKDTNPRVIADAINYLYTQREFLKEWGKEGIEVVKERFTWHNHAKKILDFSKKLQNKLIA
jgi:glycosyltransferase involved in cell wall biosynthesis